MSMLKELDHLRIPLDAIKAATNNFGDGNFIGHGGFGKVYKGELSDSKGSKTVAVKRLDFMGDQGQQEFLTEIAMLSSYKHDNLVSLQGFCDEDVEKILVYEYMSRGSLDKYVSNTDSLTWVQRLKICIGAAHGLEYLHNHVGPQHRVIHRDIKSSNILLDDNWEAKISDFGLSKIGPANQQMTFLISNAAGTLGYCDPQYAKTGILTKESDVYSFGVVLFELLCGRLACVGEYHDERRFLDQYARLCYKDKTLDGIIDQNLKKQMEPSSMNTFSAIAYRCLQKRRENRPEMALVVDELENALEFQLISKVDRQIGADNNIRQMRVLLKSNSLEQHDLDLTCEKVLDDNDVDKKELSSFRGWMNRLCLCWKPPSVDRESGHNKDVNNSSKGDDFRKDRTLWFKDIGKYAGGEYSMAVIQANNVLEDQSQIESGDFGTFIGVYDGHGGPEAARYICDHLFRNFQRLAVKDHGIVTAELIKRAFLQTERGFTALVSELWSSRPPMAAVGSCCLVGVIYKSTLFVANLGDSRAVLGKKVDISGETLAIQLSIEHNVNIEGIRKELYDLHPHDSEVVVLKHNVWRVKGMVQISRSIGDVYMKHERFNREPLHPKFRLSEPLDMPYLSATPSIVTHPLEPSDSFIIFASDGLWENLTNQQAVDIVSSHPRSGSAKRLVEAALREAAKKREMKFSDIRRISKGVLRHFLDDTTVIVLFLNHEFHDRVSVRSALDH